MAHRRGAPSGACDCHRVVDVIDSGVGVKRAFPVELLVDTLNAMPISGLHHVDLAVADVERSLEFYLAVLGPLGAVEAFRYPTYRGTEEVVYLRLGRQYLGLRRADGGEHRYYEVGIEHLAVFVDTREEVDQTYQRCVDLGVTVHFPPEEDSDEPGYWACSSSTPTACESRSLTGQAIPPLGPPSTAWFAT